jgi:hypothetical protein
MKKMPLLFLGIISGIFPLAAQDFGFDSGDDAAGTISSNFGASIGGEVSAALTAYFDDFFKGTEAVNLGDVVSGRLDFSASGSNADAVISLKVKPVFDGAAFPILIDEAYLGAYFGVFSIEAGLRKLAWGKADSRGPLDVVNAMDASDLTAITDPGSLKIARPLLHPVWSIGNFTKLEGVFVPWHEAAPLPKGRWGSEALSQLDGMEKVFPGLSLKYAQVGLRFTTTLGPADFGVQYYYGRLPNPVLAIMPGTPPTVYFDYNPYHQIGLDYAQVVAGFNIRAEAAANITQDIAGDDGRTYNPELAWSLGFDRILFADITLNIQANETIRLFKDLTATQVAATVSRTFLRGELETKIACIWEIEAADFVIAPIITWTKGDISIDLLVGIFGGDTSGSLGQYHKNNFVRLGITHAF